MNWNFRELYYGVAEDVRDTTLTDKTKRWSNEVITDFYTRKRWSWSIREDYILTVANKMLYSLPSYAARVVGVREKAARTYMRLLSGAEFHQQVPDPTSTGYSRTAIDYGFVGYKNILQSAITLVSDSASDTTNVLVTGISEGYEQSESITLTGTSSVTTTLTFSRIYGVAATAAVTGTITLTDSASRTLATIAAAATTGVITSQPATTISVVSDSANDAYSSDTNDNVRVQGRNGDGVWLEETLQLTGTTPVVTTNSYSVIEAISKQQTTDGIITATGNSRVVTTLAPNELMGEYIQLGLFPIPDQARDVQVRIRLKPPKLINDVDGFFPIPNSCYNVLKSGVMAKAWEYLKLPSRAAKSDQEYEYGIKRMWEDDQSRVPSRTFMSAVEGRRMFNYPRHTSNAT